MFLKWYATAKLLSNHQVPSLSQAEGATVSRYRRSVAEIETELTEEFPGSVAVGLIVGRHDEVGGDVLAQEENVGAEAQPERPSSCPCERRNHSAPGP